MLTTADPGGKDNHVLTQMIADAEAWIDAKKPEPVPVVEPVVDFTETEQDKETEENDKLWLLKTKASGLQDQMPLGGDLWWELENARGLGWDDRAVIKAATGTPSSG